jgi:hypothetical protein
MNLNQLAIPSEAQIRADYAALESYIRQGLKEKRFFAGSIGVIEFQTSITAGASKNWICTDGTGNGMATAYTAQREAHRQLLSDLLKAAREARKGSPRA